MLVNGSPSNLSLNQFENAANTRLELATESVLNDVQPSSPPRAQHQETPHLAAPANKNLLAQQPKLDVDDFQFSSAQDQINQKRDFQTAKISRDSNWWFKSALDLLNNRLDQVVVERQSYSVAECFCKGLELDNTNLLAWIGLGKSVPYGSNEQFTVSNSIYTQQDCFLKAIELDSSHFLGWAQLGLSMPSDDSKVLVNDKWYNQIDLLEQGIRLSPQIPRNENSH